MTVKELVEKYGLGIWIWCGKNGYPPFQILDVKGQIYQIKYPDGQFSEVTEEPHLNDYELCAQPE